jgi:hypothetical protein
LGLPPAVGDADSRGPSLSRIRGNFFGPGPRVRDQQRAAKWRQSIHNQSHNSFRPKRKRNHSHSNLIDPIQAYDKATATITRQRFPTATELRHMAHKEQSSDRVKKKLTLRDHFGLAKELTRARREQKSIASEVARQLKIGGVGSVPTVKDDNTGRFLFENFKSIG